MSFRGLIFIQKRFKYHFWWQIPTTKPKPVLNKNGEPIKERYFEPKLNEFGEPLTQYGDWLENPNETVFVRDRRIWAYNMRKVRRKYLEEYRDKFRQRLAEFTRVANAKMYQKSLREAQQRERNRLRNIRIGALNSANKATKVRMRMEKIKKHRLRMYDHRDELRNIIRKMILEKPHKNWLIKENFDKKFNMNFLEFNDSHSIKGLPNPGEYDTFEGLYKHSDIFWGDRTQRLLKPEHNITSITKTPIPIHYRQNDTSKEFIKENLPQWQPGYQRYKPDSLEYEQKPGNLMPNYWYKINWTKEVEKRIELNLDLPHIFKNPKLIEYELDKYEDFRILKKESYWKLINGDYNDINDVEQLLQDCYGDIIPDEVNLKDMIIKSLSDKSYRMLDRQKDMILWSKYNDFHRRFQHFSRLGWQYGKINFESGMRRWNKEIYKFRYMIFKDKNEHILWRNKLRNKELNENDFNLCRKAIIRLTQIEHLTLARRTGMDCMAELIGDLELDVKKVFFIWLEELCENGDNIVKGNGWSYNRYERNDIIKTRKSKQVPIEYFTINTDTINDINDMTRDNNLRIIKSH